MKTLSTIIAGAMIVLSSILPLKNSYSQTITKHYFNSDKIEVVESLEKSAVEKQFINPFVQPNDSTLNWYGSGDVNNDNKINNADLLRLDSLINQTFSDSADRRLNDRADINGDEKITNKDKQTLDDYLNKKISYLPSQWNKLTTKQERLDWFKKMIVIDKTDTIHARPPKWDCTEFTLQTHINFHGYNEYLPSKFDTINNCRFNLPVYYVYILGPLLWGAHGVNCILVEDNPLKWDDWYFNEPQTDKPVIIGRWNLPKDSSEVQIELPSDFWEDGSFLPIDFVKFSIQDSIPSLLWYDKNNLQLTRDIENSVEDEKHEKFVFREFDLEQNYPNPFNGETIIRYKIYRAGKVEIDIYNIVGQKVKDLLEGYQNPGEYKAIWDGTNNARQKVASGVYPYVLKKDGKYVKAKKMVLVK